MQRILLLAAVATLGLAGLSACDKDKPVNYETNNVVVHEEECPRSDGEPCR